MATYWSLPSKRACWTEEAWAEALAVFDMRQPGGDGPVLIGSGRVGVFGAVSSRCHARFHYGRYGSSGLSAERLRTVVRFPGMGQYKRPLRFVLGGSDRSRATAGGGWTARCRLLYNAPV
ncbi:hypothetical protein D9M70_541380 [compost metagenome]